MESQNLISVINKRLLYNPYFLSLHFFVLKMKTGPFAEHSNVLWGISSVKTWDKVNSGLLKMYKAEVCVNCT